MHRGLRLLAALVALAGPTIGRADAPIGPASNVVVGWGPAGSGTTLDAMGRTPALPFGPLRLRFVGRLAGSADGRGDERFQAGMASQLECGSSRTGAALGIGSVRRDGADRLPDVPVIESDAWMSRGSVTLQAGLQAQSLGVPRASIWITQWPPPLPGAWPASFQPYSNVLPFALDLDPRAARLATLHGGVCRDAGRWQLGLRGAVTAGQGLTPVRRVFADVAWRLEPGVALLLEAASAAPYWMTLDLTDRPHVQIGIRVEPGRVRAARALTSDEPPPSWSWFSEPQPGGSVALVLRAPGARWAEIRGDFTSWRPVPMSATTVGCWRVDLPIASGVHEVEVRADGGRWRVPPGLPSRPGAYGGRVGTLVVE